MYYVVVGPVGKARWRPEQAVIPPEAEIGFWDRAGGQWSLQNNGKSSNEKMLPELPSVMAQGEPSRRRPPERHRPSGPVC